MGAKHYLQKQGKGMPIEERTRVLNAVVHGIVMGFRKCEEMNGVESSENWEQKIMEALDGLASKS